MELEPLGVPVLDLQLELALHHPQLHALPTSSPILSTAESAVPSVHQVLAPTVFAHLISVTLKSVVASQTATPTTPNASASALLIPPLTSRLERSRPLVSVVKMLHVLPELHVSRALTAMFPTVLATSVPLILAVVLPVSAWSDLVEIQLVS